MNYLPQVTDPKRSKKCGGGLGDFISSLIVIATVAIGFTCYALGLSRLVEMIRF